MSRDFSGVFSETSPMGRPSKPDGKDNVADFLGVDRGTVRDAERHVAAVDAYPFLGQPGSRQYHAMEAAEALDELPKRNARLSSS